MGSYKHPGNLISMKCTDALDAAGYILKLTDENTVAKCGANDLPFGVALTSTKDPITGTAQSNQYVSIVTEGIVEVKLSDSNAAISVGDYIGVTTGGVADKVTIDTTDVSTLAASYKKIIGIALEDADANSGGTIKVLLRWMP